MRFKWLFMFGVLGLMLTGCQPAVKTAENNTTTEPDASTEPVGSDTPADPQVEEPAPPTFESLSDEYNEKVSDFRKAYRSAAPADRRKILVEQRPDPNDFAGKFLDLAESTGDSPDAMNCLMWIISNVRRPSRGEDYTSKAIESLGSRFKDREEIGNVLPMIASHPKPSSYKVLKDLAENSPHNNVKGIAKMAMFEFEKLIAEYKKLGDDIGQMGIPQDHVTFFREATLMSEDEKVAVLKDLEENYPGVNYGEQASGRRPVESLADMASTQMFILENLSVGKVSPEIEGVDIFGEEFKLTDYRGKVVMLDFWGDW